MALSNKCLEWASPAMSQLASVSVVREGGQREKAVPPFLQSALSGDEGRPGIPVPPQALLRE